MAKKLLALLVLAALAGLATAQDPIRIGINLELSGRFATIGNATLQGIQAAQEQMPTVNGRTVELSICDNQTTPEGSINCAARFVDEGVIGVLGAISSTMSIAAAEPLEEAGIIMISTSSTNPATTQIGEHIFRMAYTDDFQGKVAARYAADDLGAERAISSASRTTTTASASPASSPRSSRHWAARRSFWTSSPTPSTSARRSTTRAASIPTSSTTPASARRAPA